MKKMVLKEVLAVLDRIAPFETTEDWDVSGIMVGDPRQEIRMIMVALEPDSVSIEQAQRAGADLLITHHPLVFHPLRRIDLSESVPGRIERLIKEGISLVSMHTNLDTASGGVADELAKRLVLKEVQGFGALRMGTLFAPQPLRSWITTLPFPTMRIVDAGTEVRVVGLCPGSGMDAWRQAFDLGCDTFVTGDVGYHDAIDARERGMNVVDPGHFATEEIIVEPFAARLREELHGIEILAHTGGDVFQFMT
ncbi:MAG: Nif3-like dinuclear metal center hexameric protein, partial [Desulfomonilia bacterium]|nr:Nif3-like dinuclear metal center hexameric protein [Desulfomonilia bacterium]